jgi:hypothetical protein
VLAGAVVFELMNGAGPAETGPTPEEIEARLANVGRPPPIQSSSPEAVEDARPLVEPSIEAAPAGKPLKELTDKQLLGVIVGRTSAESSVIEALKLGRERRIAQLADAAVVPLSNDAYLVRVEAAKVLLALGDRRVVPRLALALDDHDPLVRAQVARSLGGLRDRRALSSLSARLGVEDSVVVRREVKRAIAEISGVPFPE